MNNYLRAWFQRNHDANFSLIELSLNPEAPSECLEILDALMIHHETWLNRICTVEIQQLNFGQHLKARNSLIHGITENFLRSESYGSNLDWKFFYIMEGEMLQQSLLDAYFHILNFSTFHRGRVYKLLEMKNITSLATISSDISSKAQISR